MTGTHIAAAQPSAVDRHVQTPHGSVFVRDLPGVDPVVVLLHGYPDDHKIYTRLMPLLAPYRVVAFDLLGYGRSDRSDSAGVSMADHGAQIGAVLDVLGIQRAVLVGHDGSGPDTVVYALDHPDRVQHLVLLNTFFGNQPSLRMPEMTRLFADPQLATLADDMTDDPAQLLWLLQRWGTQWELDNEPDGIAMQSIVPQFFGNDDHPAALAAIRRWTADLHGSLDRQDDLIARGALRDMAVRVSIVFGAADRYLNSCLASELRDLFGTASLDLIADAGHYPQHDQPQAVAALIQRALSA